MTNQWSQLLHFDGTWWQLLSVLLLLLTIFLVRRLLFWITNFLLFRWLHLWRKLREAPPKKTLHGFTRPLSFLLAFFVLLSLLPVLRLPANLVPRLTMILHFLLALSFTIASCRLVAIAVLYLRAYLQRSSTYTLSPHVVLFGKVALYVMALSLGIALMLNSIGISFLHLLAGLSVGGLAVALAAQDTFKNLFGSVMILVDRPFKEGDWIASDHVDGVVESIGLRATRIRTFEDSLLYISNASLSEAPLNNYGLRKHRRYYTRLPLSYRTPTTLLHVFVEGLREIVKRHPHTVKDNYEIHIHEYTDTHIYIMFYIFFDVSSWSAELSCRHEVNVDIRALADFLGVELGVDFALFSPAHADTSAVTKKHISVRKTQVSSSSPPKNLRDFFDKTQ